MRGAAQSWAPDGRYSGSNPVIARGSGVVERCARVASRLAACPGGLRIGHVSMGRVCALCSRAAGLPRWWAWILLLCAWGRAARWENPDAFVYATMVRALPIGPCS